MKNIKVLSIIGILFMSGCAVHKEYAATGGSRSDGTIELSYQVEQFEKPRVNEEQGKQLALSKCKKWGYNDAEAFGGKETDCQARNGYGNCISAKIITQYQCVGNLEHPEPQASSQRNQGTQKSSTGKFSYEAERTSKNQNCASVVNAESIEPAKEIYSAECYGGKKIFIVCTNTDCVTQ